MEEGTWEGVIGCEDSIRVMIAFHVYGEIPWLWGKILRI
jgi:hypothetical protein